MKTQKIELPKLLLRDCLEKYITGEDIDKLYSDKKPIYLGTRSICINDLPRKIKKKLKNRAEKEGISEIDALLKFIKEQEEEEYEGRIINMELMDKRLEYYKKLLEEKHGK